MLIRKEVCQTMEVSHSSLITRKYQWELVWLPCVYVYFRGQSTGYVSLNLLNTWIFDDISPFYWIIKFGLELCCKVGIGEAWRIELLHQRDDVWTWLGAFPPVPEPLVMETGNGVHPPVDEHADLGVIVPGRQRSGVYGVPVRGILCIKGWQWERNENKKHSDISEATWTHRGVFCLWNHMITEFRARSILVPLIFRVIVRSHMDPPPL